MLKEIAARPTKNAKDGLNTTSVVVESYHFRRLDHVFSYRRKKKREPIRIRT